MCSVAQVLVTMDDPYINSQLQELAELSGITESALPSGATDAQLPTGDMVMLRQFSRQVLSDNRPDELPLGAPPPPPTSLPPAGAPQRRIHCISSSFNFLFYKVLYS